MGSEQALSLTSTVSRLPKSNSAEGILKDSEFLAMLRPSRMFASRVRGSRRLRKDHSREPGLSAEPVNTCKDKGCVLAEASSKVHHIRGALGSILAKQGGYVRKYQ